MRNLQRMLFVSSILVFSIMSSGCTWFCPETICGEEFCTKVVVVKKCPGVTKPTYANMTEDEYGYSRNNTELLMNNSLLLKNYSNDLEGVVQCYEAQTVDNRTLVK